MLSKKNGIFAAAMTSNNTLHIDLFAAARSGQKQCFNLSDSFFEELDQEEIVGGQLQVTALVKEKTGDYFSIQFTAKGEVSVLCDRCLERVVYDVEVEDEALVYYGDGEPSNIEARVLPPRINVYDLAWDVYEAVELSLPLQRIHPAGQCNPDMVEHLKALEATQDGEDDEEAE